MKLINVEPKDNYILRIFLDDDSIVDFDIKAELERIPGIPHPPFILLNYFYVHIFQQVNV